MIKVKMLKPYYVKVHMNTLRIVLAYQYFSVFINHQVYHFIPIEASDIRVNLHSKKVENTEARFAFQKGKDMIYMTMAELICLPGFLVQLHTICEPYYESGNKGDDTKNLTIHQTTDLIAELEMMNVRRLIDKALDERDMSAFKELIHHL